MTIDSNIVIAYLAGEEIIIETLSKWQTEGRPLFLSTLAEAEVLSFPDSTTAERQKMHRFIKENFVSAPFDRILANIAANIRRQYKIKLPDAAIAATSLYTGTPLVTRNQRDFKKIPGLTIVSI